MAKPNYRQVKRQKDQARKTRQLEKMERRVSQVVHTTEGAAGVPAASSEVESSEMDPADARP